MPRRTVLIADDEPNLIRSLSYILEKEGYRVESSSDGPETFSKIRDLRPDVVILDVVLPGLDGLEICRRIKTDPELRLTPVIILSAKAQQEDRQKGRQAGADAYMSKPFSTREIIDQLRELLGPTDAPGP